MCRRQYRPALVWFSEGAWHAAVQPGLFEQWDAAQAIQSRSGEGHHVTVERVERRWATGRVVYRERPYVGTERSAA